MELLRKLKKHAPLTACKLKTLSKALVERSGLASGDDTLEIDRMASAAVCSEAFASHTAFKALNVFPFILARHTKTGADMWSPHREHYIQGDVQ